MRRILLLVLFLMPALLCGAAFDDILSSAYSTSFEAESARLRYESGLLDIAQAELDDKTDYSVSLAVSPLENETEIISISDLSFSATLPDDDTLIRASIPFSVRYDGSGGYLSPLLSVSHAFDWGRDDDILENLQIALSRLSVDRSFDSDLLSLESSVLGSISSILENERSLMESEENLRDLKRELSDSLSLGMITEDSLNYIELQFSIKREEDSIAILDRERAELEKVFSNLTGMEWNGVDSIPLPSFPDILSYTTASTLKEAELASQIASEEYLLEESRQNPKRLTVGAEAGSGLYLGNGLGTAGREDASISVSGSVGWEGKEWSFSLSGGGSWDDNYSFSPSLTVSGSWHSNSSSDSDRILLSSLQNEAILKRGEYLDARRVFSEEGGNLWNRILSWNREYSEMEAEIEYRKALLENMETRYERGLATEEELHDASFDLELLSLDRSILILDGLSLEAEAKRHII